uniref:Uncharacterized protein n=1 Tax=Candidatus Methanophagaceae archaeon ANME-1 ERB6 TaxID=2759912 RepID=A0A7G9Z035_9EURY|nr:hypothetical protein NGENPBHE_00019 [Methanosarcinales archaeon ANME-1 ERB6]
MARPRGKIEIVCQNQKCRYYLKDRGKDVIKSGKYKRAPGTRGFIASIARPILWRPMAHRYIENKCPRVK